ncbi:MAG TPA: ABC transporter ATP-binding protein [Phycisphaerae bacterium]|nr:ABC transporter ATP-binding protein [Phycisphaerae bacterium]
MGAEPAITAHRVFKKFRRGEQFDSLRDLVAAHLRGRRRSLARAEFWALHDVGFEVRGGEAFGIIGPNGAGKSTLLKLLAGILRPTSGSIDVRGRISALIELGAGFHGDLTGRENIYLNASILGMSRRETRRKFDDIVAFAGIDDFLDTPVKRYSSGMHARLGFAIAAHVDPQVMLVDEVLSVGDRVFRSKCVEKMRAFLKQGVAIVFVSHDLGTVSRFCDRAMVLLRGQEAYTGPATQAVGHYYNACAEPLLIRGAEEAAPARVSNVRLTGPDSEQELTTVRPGEAVRFQFEVRYDMDMAWPSYGLSVIRMEDHLVLFETSSSRLGLRSPPARRGDHHAVCYDFQMNLPPGEYAIGLHIRERDAMTYAVQDAYVSRLMVDSAPVSGGLVYLDPHVEVSQLSHHSFAAVAM